MSSKINNKLETALSRIGIKKLFFILFLIFGFVTLGVFIVSRYKSIYSVIYHERLSKLKYIDDFALEVLQDEDYYVKTKQLTLNQAKKETIGILKDVKFENHDYMWIADYGGKIIYHPNKKLIGTNLIAYKDSKGNNFGYDLVNSPKKSGSAYVYYYWPKPDDINGKTYPKVSYVVAFKDWNWIVGTGLYIDDIKLKVTQSMYDGSFPVLVISLYILLVFSYIIWAAIIVPIQELANKSLQLANNDLDVIIPVGDKNTEFGKLYSAFNKFVEFFKEKRNSEQKLSLILDNITDSLITVDNTGIIQALNPSVEEMFGYLPQELLGANVNLLVSPAIFNESKIADKIVHANGKYQMLGIKKNEEFFPIEVNINNFLYNDENLYILLIRDITEEKEVERMKNEFVSIVSHELRTPLTSIRGSLGLALSGAFPTVTGKIKDLLDIAHNNSLRLINLINDILDIEKIAAGKMEFCYENLNVSDAIENIISMNKPYAYKFNVEYMFINNLNEDASINVDKGRFTQVLTNLLSNATKFSPEKDKIIVSADYNNEFIKISIKDNGKGIPDEFKDKIFDKFTQADSSDTRQKGGTGLGLSICKSLVEEMNGRIGFESKLNSGTTFYVEFPKV